jgi:hypothetical protein
LRIHPIRPIVESGRRVGRFAARRDAVLRIDDACGRKELTPLVVRGGIDRPLLRCDHADHRQPPRQARGQQDSDRSAQCSSWFLRRSIRGAFHRDTPIAGKWRAGAHVRPGGCDHRKTDTGFGALAGSTRTVPQIVLGVHSINQTSGVRKNVC